MYLAFARGYNEHTKTILNRGLVNTRIGSNVMSRHRDHVLYSERDDEIDFNRELHRQEHIGFWRFDTLRSVARLRRVNRAAAILSNHMPFKYCASGGCMADVFPPI